MLKGTSAPSVIEGLLCFGQCEEVVLLSGFHVILKNRRYCNSFKRTMHYGRIPTLYLTLQIAYAGAPPGSLGHNHSYLHLPQTTCTFLSTTLS